MSKYAGNKWDDEFTSIEEAVAVTRYRMAEEIYQNLSGIYAMTLGVDEKEKSNLSVIKIHAQLMANNIESILNGNQKTHREFVKRNEADYRRSEGKE